MFDIAWSEMVVIGAVALIAIGPKDLPKALRAVGAMTAKARRMAAEFQDHFREAMREAELESVQQEVANIKQDLAATTSGLQSEFNAIGQQLPDASQPIAQPAETPQDTALQDTALKVETGKVETADLEPPKSETSSGTTPSGMGEAAQAPLTLTGAVHSTDAKETAKPATTLSVEARPDAVTVTETVVAANGHAGEAPPAKPARKKRDTKPKPKSGAKSDTMDVAPQSDLLQAANGAPAPVKAPRKRTPKAAAKVSSAKAPQTDVAPAQASPAQVSSAEVSPAKDLPANTFPPGDDRAA